MAAEVSKPDFSFQWASGGSIVAPSDVKVQTGWTAEVPPFQWENYLQNRQDNAILHLFQKGVSEWDAASNYYFTTSGVRSYVQGSDGVVYVAVQDSIGQNPTTDATDTYWKVAWVDQTALAAAQAISAPVVGVSINLRASIPTASATATFTADELVVGVTLTGARYKLSFFSKVINLATTGVGGMDTGTATASSWIGVYAIYNPTTSTSALLAVNAANTVIPAVYGGANMPAGYTASCLISVLRTTAASLFDVAFQTGSLITYLDHAAVNSGTIVGSLTNISISGNIPGNAKTVNFKGNIASSSANVTLSFAAAGSTTGIGNMSAGSTNSVGGAGFSSQLYGVPIITAQNAAYSASVSAGTMTFILSTTGYTI